MSEKNKASAEAIVKGFEDVSQQLGKEAFATPEERDELVTSIEKGLTLFDAVLPIISPIFIKPIVQAVIAEIDKQKALKTDAG